jgi:hypothetical protein
MRTRRVHFGSISARLATSGAVFLVACLSLLSGCNHSDPLPSRMQEDPPAQGAGRSACDLLKDDEIQRAIGSHSSGRPNVSDMTGKSVMANMWGFQSCRWTATTAQQIQGFPNGWFDKIELKVFDKERSGAARKEAEGEPVKAFEEERYDATNGRLGFNCGHDQYCMLSADTANGDIREQLVRGLAALVRDRLK